MRREYNRRSSQKQLVLAKLIGGPATNHELNKIAFRYSARLLELRREGWNIHTEDKGDGVFLFTLRGRKQETPKPEPGTLF